MQEPTESHLFGNYAFWRYTYIPKLCHRYSQVAGEDSIEFGGKRMENLESVCAVEGCALIFPRLRSPIPINTPDCKGHLQAWTACSNWSMWLQDSSRRCCSSWSRLAAMLIRFRVSKSVPPVATDAVHPQPPLSGQYPEADGGCCRDVCDMVCLQIWSCLSRLLVTWPSSQYRWTPRQTYPI